MKGLSLLMTKPCKKKTDGLKNKNTTKADAKAEKKFVTYLKKKGFQQEFWLIGKQELDKILCKFWFEIRTKNREYYRLGSLENRVLHKKGHEFDIVHELSFKKSREAFKTACTELKSIGKGIRVPYKEIRPKGMYKTIFNTIQPVEIKLQTFQESKCH